MSAAESDVAAPVACATVSSEVVTLNSAPVSEMASGGHGDGVRGRAARTSDSQTGHYRGRHCGRNRNAMTSSASWFPPRIRVSTEENPLRP